MDQKPDNPLPSVPPLRSHPLSEEEEIRRRRLGEKAARKLEGRFTSETIWDRKQLLRRLTITGGTMLLSLIAAGFYYGWVFGIGLVLLIFLHECGHVWASQRLGMPVGDMIFVPFLGAFVTLQHHDDRTERAYVALMGPVFGAVGGLLCAAIGYTLNNILILDLAEFNFGITLLNLLPIPPLDGRWIAPILAAEARKSRYYGKRVLPLDAPKQLGAAYIGLAVVLALALYWVPQSPIYSTHH